MSSPSGSAPAAPSSDVHSERGGRGRGGRNVHSERGGDGRGGRGGNGRGGRGGNGRGGRGGRGGGNAQGGNSERGGSAHFEHVGDSKPSGSGAAPREHFGGSRGGRGGFRGGRGGGFRGGYSSGSGGAYPSIDLVVRPYVETPVPDNVHFFGNPVEEEEDVILRVKSTFAAFLSLFFVLKACFGKFLTDAGQCLHFFNPSSYLPVMGKCMAAPKKMNDLDLFAFAKTLPRNASFSEFGEGVANALYAYVTASVLIPQVYHFNACVDTFYGFKFALKNGWVVDLGAQILTSPGLLTGNMFEGVYTGIANAFSELVGRSVCLSVCQEGGNLKNAVVVMSKNGGTYHTSQKFGDAHDEYVDREGRVVPGPCAGSVKRVVYDNVVDLEKMSSFLRDSEDGGVIFVMLTVSARLELHQSLGVSGLTMWLVTNQRASQKPKYHRAVYTSQEVMHAILRTADPRYSDAAKEFSSAMVAWSKVVFQCADYAFSAMKEYLKGDVQNLDKALRAVFGVDSANFIGLLNDMYNSCQGLVIPGRVAANFIVILHILFCSEGPEVDGKFPLKDAYFLALDSDLCGASDSLKVVLSKMGEDEMGVFLSGVIDTVLDFLDSLDPLDPLPSSSSAPADRPKDEFSWWEDCIRHERGGVEESV